MKNWMCLHCTVLLCLKFMNTRILDNMMYIGDYCPHLSPMYKIVFSILSSRFIPHVDRIAGDHQSGEKMGVQWEST